MRHLIPSYYFYVLVIFLHENISLTNALLSSQKDTLSTLTQSSLSFRNRVHTSTTNLYIYTNTRRYPSSSFEPENNNPQKINRQRPYKEDVLIETSTSTQTSTNTPPLVQTLPQRIPIKPHTPKPKILVLGSTGHIGRHVIKSLMSLKQEIHIVAFVRDYEKACEVLYDELIREHHGKRLGMPTLQVVVMDLVPDEDVAGYERRKKKKEYELLLKKKIMRKKTKRKKNQNYYNDDEEDDEHEEEDDDEEEEEDEMNYAVSAARFYNDKIEDYDFKDENINLDYIDPYQPLYDAMQNATAVISTIGTIRETIPFIDYVMKPWRIFLRPDKWCDDPSHPYYVNYMVMKKVLDCAEREQLKRDCDWDAWLEANENDEDDDDESEEDSFSISSVDGSSSILASNSTSFTNNNTSSNIVATENPNDLEDDTILQQSQVQQHSKKKRGDRIRIVRISDLCVGKPPWDFVTMFTNIMRSLVFRSQERCEKLLLKSEVVDTIVLRPGDLLNESRNENKTLIEVDIDGYLPSPCYVGREDVAELATIASLSSMDFKPSQRQTKQVGVNSTELNTAIMGGGDNKVLNDGVSKTRKEKPDTSSNLSANRQKAKHWNVAVGWVDKNSIRTSTMSNNEARKRFKHDNMKKAFRYIVKEEGIRTRMASKKRLKNPLFRWMIQPIQKQMKHISLGQTKPYGIFVLLPMLFMVYPMMCSIAFSIGSKIPFVQKFALCFLTYLKPIWFMIIQQIRSSTFGNMYKADPSQLKRIII